MPIDPTLSYNTGSIQGVVAKVGDLDRRLRAIEAFSGQLAPNSVTNAAIGPSQINGANISPGSITVGHITAGGITASWINAASIAAATGTFININASQITAGTINAAQLSATTVAAVLATLGSLSAITGNMGALTAGSITGATVQTGAGAIARVVMDAAGLRGYAADGVTKTFDLNTGTGVLSATGVITLTPGSNVPGPALYGAQLGGGNLVPNSSFEQGQQPGDPTDRRAEGWQVAGSIAGTGPSTTFVYHGSNSYKLLATAGNVWLGRRDVAGVRIPVVAGRKYTASVWIYNPTGQPVRQASMFVYWFTENAGGANIGSSNGVNVQGTGTASATTSLTVGDWTRVVYTVTAPATATYAGFIGHIWSVATNEAFYYDGFQFEQGDVPTAYAPTPNEILYGSLRSVFIGAGEIKANNIQAGAVTASALSVKWGSANMVRNARFSYYTGNVSDPGVTVADSPGYWRHYDNGGAGTATWSKVAGLGPTGENAWRLVTDAATTAAKGFMTQSVLPFKSGVSYILSFYWKGNQPPTWAANGSAVGTWIDNPAPSTTVWQRYSVKIVPSADGPSDSAGGALVGGGYDWLYVRPNSVGLATDVQIANIQREIGDYPTPFAPAADELLPYSVGNTVLTPDSVTTDKILANTILAGDIYLVGGLSALTANIGAITSGSITGATIATAPAGNYRAYMDSSGFYYKDLSGNNLISMSGSSITVSNMSFTNLYYGSNNANSYMRWYTGNYAALVGWIGLGADGTNSVSETVVQINGGTGVAEWRAIGRNSSSGEKLTATLQHSSAAADSFRIIWDSGGGTSRTVLQADETGDVSVMRDLRVLWTGPGLATGSIISVNSGYMRVNENWGWRFDGGNYTTMTYGGSGCTHVVMPNSGQSTAGAAYTLGWSYAVGHSNYSDEKLKYDIRDIPQTAALSRVRATRPVKYELKGGARTGFTQDGFIAQELVEIFPDAVERLVNVQDPKDSTTFAVNPMAMIASLTAAVQELSEIVNILRGEAPNAPLSRETVTSIVKKTK